MSLVLKRLGVVDMTTLQSKQIPNIMAGVGDATSFGLTKEHTDITIEDGQDTNHLTRYQLAIRGIAQDDNLSFLQAINDNNRFVKFVGVGVGTVLQWGIPVRLVWLSKLDDKLHTWKIGSGIEVRTGYDPNTGIMDGGIHAGYNLLGMYRWGSAQGSNIPYGFELTGNTDGTTFADNKFTANLSDTNNNFQLTRRVLFPFPNNSLTVSVDRLSSGCNINLRVRCFDKNGTELNQACSVFRSSDSATLARISDTGKTPAGTHEIEFEIDVEYTGSSTGVAEFRYPCIRVDGKSEYSPI